ncbi:hypothetical protein [Streptantibioticus ferralitis]|uniref:Peptidase inhibitor family I36 n=1 Tax=Streptantibioticus ferralitis TaxID=236510 RepID=A0ABT5YZE1_9ACTN|nr:hypothetical protein [Streptantibioticus ferralitis]MDF2256155.1 hypothetical protein [Streptantibioticus ferralitis]
MLRRFRGPALAAASALVLLTALPGSTQAASGSYTYVTAAGQGVQVLDPQSDTCLPLTGGAVRFSNDTTDTAFLYGDSSCGGGWALVGVGATWDAPTGVQAFAVRFGSTSTNNSPSRGARP